MISTTATLLIATTGLLPASVHAADKGAPPCCRELAISKPLTDKSLYQLDSVWTSDVGKNIKLGVLRGRPQVLAFFFTSCEYACPIIVHDMKLIQDALPSELRQQVDFVLITFDTDRDTTDALRIYRERQNLGTDHWTLLRGRSDDVRELTALLGINYQKDARGQFAHSNVITLLNTDGEIVFQQIGLNKPAAQFIKHILTAT